MENEVKETVEVVEDVASVDNTLKDENQRLAKEIHSLKSQLGNATKELTTLKNKDLTAEQLYENKKKELEEKEEKIKMKELELEKQIQLGNSKIFKEFEEFITITTTDTTETIKQKIAVFEQKQEAFRNSLLKEYSITKNANVSVKDKSLVLKELGILTEPNYGLEELK